MKLILHMGIALMISVLHESVIVIQSVHVDKSNTLAQSSARTISSKLDHKGYPRLDFNNGLPDPPAEETSDTCQTSHRHVSYNVDLSTVLPGVIREIYLHTNFPVRK